MMQNTQNLLCMTCRICVGTSPTPQYGGTHVTVEMRRRIYAIVELATRVEHLQSASKLHREEASSVQHLPVDNGLTHTHWRQLPAAPSSIKTPSHVSLLPFSPLIITKTYKLPNFINNHFYYHLLHLTSNPITMSLFRTNFPSSGDFAPLFRLLDDYDNHRSSRQSPTLRSFAPRFDVRESADAYHLDGELPGIAQKDINIEFTDSQTLVVKGRTEREYTTTEPQAENGGEQAEAESTTSKAKQQHRYWASERSVGEFQRTFSFPTRVDQDAVKASLKNGILSVLVPKATATATKKITIE